MIRGEPKADGLAISAITAEADRMGFSVTATVRMVDTKTGATHTSCKIGNAPNVWSKNTHEKLTELIATMEKDVAGTLLYGHRDEPEDRGIDLTGDDISGIGEHIGQESI